MGEHSKYEPEPVDLTPLVGAEQTRPVQAIAALALVIIAIGTVAALAYSALISGSEAALSAVLSIATGAVGALIAMAGAKRP
jgi:hypothetical protein